MISSIETERAAALHRYSLPNAPCGAFDRVTKLAARLLRVPIALISIVESDQIWFLSHHGTSASQIPIEEGLCSMVITSNKPIIIDNIQVHPHTKDRQIVRELGFKFYAAIPLAVNDGHNIGALCVIDREERQFTSEDIELLSDLAQIVVDELELRLSMKRIIHLEKEIAKTAIAERDKARHIAHHDALTGLPNRLLFMHELESEIVEPMEPGKVPAILMLDLDKFKSVNDTFGHQAGDLLLKEVAKRVKSCVSGLDIPARLGGDEFVVLQRNTTPDEAEKLAALLVEKLSQPYEIDEEVISYVSASVGLTIYHPRDTGRQMIRNADLALYCAKSNGRKNYQVYNTSIDNSIITRHRA